MHIDEDHRILPTLVGGRNVFESRVVMTATGKRITVVVTEDGCLWISGGEGDSRSEMRRLIMSKIGISLSCFALFLFFWLSLSSSVSNCVYFLGVQLS